MYPNSIYFGLEVVPIIGTLGAKVYTTWAHGPLGIPGVMISGPPGCRGSRPADSLRLGAGGRLSVDAVDPMIHKTSLSSASHNRI